VTVYTAFALDPVWILLAVAAVVSLIAGQFGKSRLGPAVSGWLVGAGVLLLAGLVAYSLLVTWATTPPGAAR
jgi:uncharacterized membrane protein